MKAIGKRWQAVVGMAALVWMWGVPGATGTVISYWDFEGTDPGEWLEDKAGTNNFSISNITGPDPSQWDLGVLNPGDRGYYFPNPIPLTGAANRYGVDFYETGGGGPGETGTVGGRLETARTMDFNRNSFSVEGFFNSSDVSIGHRFWGIGDGSKFQAIGRVNAVADQDYALFRITLYNPTTGSFSGNVDSTLRVYEDTDYYMAWALSSGASPEDRFVEFWLRDLSDGEGSLQSEKVSLSDTFTSFYQDTTNGLRFYLGHDIPVAAAGNVRYSDGVLSESQLVIPEPQTLGLLLLGVASFAVRRFRRCSA